MVPSGEFDRFPLRPQSTPRTAPHHAGPEPPEHAHIFGGRYLLQHYPEALEEERERGIKNKRKRKLVKFKWHPYLALFMNELNSFSVRQMSACTV